MIRSRQIFEVPLPGLYLGGYLAKVVSLDDDKKANRVQIRLLNFDGVEGHDGPVWARVSSPFAGKNRGAYFLPDVGDEVLVTFVNGDSRLPVIVGGLWNGESNSPAAVQSGGVNQLKVLRSKNGVKMTLDDKDGKEQFIVETPAGQKITLKDGPGKILIEDSNGNSIKLESSGITITASAKVSITATGKCEVKAGQVDVTAALSKFNGMIQCNALISDSVVSKSYTLGAGNVW